MSSRAWRWSVSRTGTRAGSNHGSESMPFGDYSSHPEPSPARLLTPCLSRTFVPAQVPEAGGCIGP
jgi:hypothetical protein